MGIPLWKSMVPGRWDELSWGTGILFDRYRKTRSDQPENSVNNSRWQVPLGFSARVYTANRETFIEPALQTHLFYYSLPSDSSLKTFVLASPRIGAQIHLIESLRLRGVIGSYYRAPSMNEIYGDSVSVAPAIDLKYEKALKGEVGADYDWKNPVSGIRNVSASYTYSRSRAANLISLIQNSQDTFIAINIGESFIQTHEFVMAAQSDFGFRSRTGLTLMETKNLSAVSYQRGKELPLRSPYQIQAGVGYDFKNWGVDYKLSHVGPMYGDVGNTKRLSSTMSHSVQTKFKDDSWGEFILEFNNIFNEITSKSAYTSDNQRVIDNTTGYPGFPSPGRRIYLTWIYQI